MQQNANTGEVKERHTEVHARQLSRFQVLIKIFISAQD